MKKRKLYPVAITGSKTVGTAAGTGWRVVEEVQRMSDGSERKWYRGASADLREACGYGLDCPPLTTDAAVQP